MTQSWNNKYPKLSKVSSLVFNAKFRRFTFKRVGYTYWVLKRSLFRAIHSLRKRRAFNFPNKFSLLSSNISYIVEVMNLQYSESFSSLNLVLKGVIINLYCSLFFSLIQFLRLLESLELESINFI